MRQVKPPLRPQPRNPLRDALLSELADLMPRWQDASLLGMPRDAFREMVAQPVERIGRALVEASPDNIAEVVSILCRFP